MTQIIVFLSMANFEPVAFFRFTPYERVNCGQSARFLFLFSGKLILELLGEQLFKPAEQN